MLPESGNMWKIDLRFAPGLPPGWKDRLFPFLVSNGQRGGDAVLLPAHRGAAERHAARQGDKVDRSKRRVF